MCIVLREAEVTQVDMDTVNMDTTPLKGARPREEMRLFWDFRTRGTLSERAASLSLSQATNTLSALGTPNERL